MDTLAWGKLTEINGRLNAELLESYLEANGIDVELFQEAVGRYIYPVTIDGLGLVQVFVPKSKMQEAKDLLANYQSESEGN